jgi:hypothetical protein
MAESKLNKPAATKAKVAKPKTAKTKVAAKKPAPKAKAKVEVKKPEAKVVKQRRPRKVKDALSNYATLLKKQAEIEAIKRQAKAELKKHYDSKIREADAIRAQYKELFGEAMDSTPRIARKGKVRKGAVKARGYTLSQVQSYLDQRDSGKAIKVEGKNATGIKRIKEAYEKADPKDAKTILAILSK